MAETSWQKLGYSWIRAQLSANATLSALVGGRFYARIVPETDAYPCVVIAYGGVSEAQGGAERSQLISVINNDRIGVWLLFQVKAVCKADSLDKLDEIAGELDRTLHRANGAVAGGKVLACLFRNVIEYDNTNDAGVTFYFNGAFYEVLVQKV